jgi:ATP-dependent protease Clp ATPase subunit
MIIIVDQSNYFSVEQRKVEFRVTLNSIHFSQEDLMIIANDKERGVISQLKALLSLNDCELEFSEDALRAVAELAFCKKTGKFSIVKP